MRAVVDTNVLSSALFWLSTPHALIEQVLAGGFILLASPALLAELAGVMNQPKFQAILARSDTDTERMLGELRRLAEIIDPPPLPTPAGRDLSDGVVLALAAAQANLIVIGDADLLELGSYAASRSLIQPTQSSRSAAEVG